MTLKEKFKDIIDDSITYKQQEDSFVQLAEEFAIGFAEWVECSKIYYTPVKELLEIYKKEKDYENKNKYDTKR
jgi:hypothetical protein